MIRFAMIKPHADPQILRLGSDFYDPVEPARFPKAILRYWNERLAENLNFLDWTEKQKQTHFCSFQALPGNLHQPLALRYHGHQFMHYNPDLGDGRGFLYAQIRTEQGLFEFGTKGSGQTPYSRNGDGRLTLKGAVREALATELLETLGVTTSKTFAFFETGESLHRGDEPSPTRSAVLTRYSETHLRIGTFQRLAFLKQPENISKLAHYVLENYYPEAVATNHPCRLLLELVIDRQALLVAQLMVTGFVHGVLNTDNLNLTGENFDYGPYRFLPTYQPDFTAAYFDHSGLYAFAQQPRIFAWNLQQLGKALQIAEPEIDVEASLKNFGDLFSSKVAAAFLKRLNLQSISEDKDTELMAHFYQALFESQSPFEQAYFDFFGGFPSARWENSPQKDFYQHSSFKTFKELLKSYTCLKNNKLDHAYFQGEKPVTLLYPEIEKLWQSIADQDDWSGFQQKLSEFRFARGLYLLQET
jgi:uncharacterized protein YdiU (UPF0061 family)